MIDLRSLALAGLSILSPVASWGAADWADWRGPSRDGRSDETGLPTSWSPSGENLAWKSPYGGRSAPIVLGDQLFLQNAAGEGDSLQERVLSLNTDTGELLWEHRFNVYASDVPPHRVGWASPAGDGETGNVYAYGVNGTLLALSRDGKLVWERSLNEDFGLITTHGGRTVSPILDGDLVIVSGLNSGWGDQARGGHRFFAFDKRTGETVWISSPGGQPFDTTYSPPIVAEVSGTRLLIAGAGDGAFHALKPQTGEPVWNYLISKRGINTGAVLKGNVAFVSHGEENTDTSDMGLVAAIDAAATGPIGEAQIKWKQIGFLAGFSSPVIDGDRLYQIDNSANLAAFDVATGSELWRLSLGTAQRASPVLADGKLYVGSENGKFYILRPGPDAVEKLDEDQLGTEADPETVTASVAVSRGRIFLVSRAATYCIGKKSSTPETDPRRDRATAAGAPAHLQVVPAEVVLEPGESVSFRARLFDGRGIFIGERPASWTLQGLEGSFGDAGALTVSSQAKAQAGEVKAAVGEISGRARVRIIPPLPLEESFDGLPVDTVPRHWINATGKFRIREIEGNQVLVKLADNPATKRARGFIGHSDASDYTIQADVLATEKRRQMGDAGIIAQRYSLVLFGSHQKLELHPWQPETHRTVVVKFPWKPETWYRMKLQVENLSDGTAMTRGKVWQREEPEPAAWTIERVDPIPNLQGSPGLYADASAEVYFDNLKVTRNP